MSRTLVPVEHRALAGLLAGVLGGGTLALLMDPPPGLGWNLLIGGVLGLVFGILFGSRIQSLGGGLVWGQAYGILWWLLGSLTLVPLVSGKALLWNLETARTAFPLLLGLVVAYGAVLGLTYHPFAWTLARLIPLRASTPAEQPAARTPTAQTILAPLAQAALIGGFGGLLGSWVFMRGIEDADFFPLVAGLTGSSSMGVGKALHYLIGAIIGISFGLLFHRDLQGAGSTVIWGMNYGLLWWILGPLTLMPWFLGAAGGPDWSLAMARAAFPSLVAHLLYGALVGLIYALVNRMWQILFVDSDPLNRPLEGAGARGLRGLLMGQAGGLVGGLLFTIVMVGVGALPRVASLVGAESSIAGFLVHLIIAAIIGSSYGLLFQREAYSYGSGMAWGTVYGLLWWLLGVVTLFAMLLRQPVDWSLPSVVGLYPSLVGHLLYGAGLGLFYQFLARRFDAELCGRAQLGSLGTRFELQGRRGPRRRCAGTPASALWVVTLTLGVMLPLLLAAG